MAKVVWHNKKDTIARVEREYRAVDRVVRRLGSKSLEEPVPGFGSRARIRRERWLRKDALAVVAFHREVGKEIRAAMRALPDAYYKKRFSPIWPNDLVGHSTWHREHHLET